MPQYEGIVVSRNNVYGLIDSEGKTLLPIALQSIYSITSEGEETYYMLYNNQLMNVIDYIKKWVRPDKNESNNQTNTENTENTNNEQTTQNTQQNNTSTENTTQTNTNAVENNTNTNVNKVSNNT